AEHAEIAENYFDADVTVPEKYSSAISAISAVTFPRTSISPILVDVILLDGSSLTIEQLIAIADRGEPIALSDVARERVRASRAVVDRRARSDEPAYGINTGFGSFAAVKTALVLVGEGEGLDVVRGAEALARAGLRPITLGPKEGLALINGTQPSTAVLALALASAEQLARAADVAAALSIDALRGSIHPFERRIHDARPFPGQQVAAANIEGLMHGSGINKSHEFCGKVQDAYSMRCTAQVHGAVREALRFVRET